MKDKIFIEVECLQKNHEGERICGDVFLSRKVLEENRVVIVLSDGMGHGVKANVLATLTATMAIKFTEEHKEAKRTAEIIMNTLPECSERKMNYATFTIIDIENDGRTTILQYDNPESIVLRSNTILPLEWNCIILDSEQNAGKEIMSCTFMAQKDDRIIFCSDGVTQSGLGSKEFPFGWGTDKLASFAQDVVKHSPEVSSRQLASRILNVANRNDNYQMKDDTSIGVVYFREPRKLLICTGPPYEKEDDSKLAGVVGNFKGKRILMGATTAEIVSRELNLEIQDRFEFQDTELPPITFMDSIDLVTEGILTLAKVEQVLQKYHSNFELGHGPADEVIKLIRDSDDIRIVVGTRVNIAHQDPRLPVELEIRRAVVKRIATLMEQKMLKHVEISYI